ncbi:hypothetical protein J4436_02260 [Candidatus Woesearchaeota archaeon]|nr:hypothetical protein [Candidatus Woesearchaeota archaeon]
MKYNLKKISEYEYELDKLEGMIVKAKLIMNDKLFEGIEDDVALQLSNVCSMPGIVEPVIALPDAHVGF